MKNVSDRIMMLLALWMTGCGVLLIINLLNKVYEFICSWLGRGSDIQTFFTVIIAILLPLGLGYLLNFCTAKPKKETTDRI